MCGALGFGSWLFGLPGLARQPFFFFSFVFLADAGLLALPVMGRAHRGIAAREPCTIALHHGGLDRVVCSNAPLHVSLVAIVIFALLHAATTPASAWRPKRSVRSPPRAPVTPFVLSGHSDRTGGSLQSDAGLCGRAPSRARSCWGRDR